MYSFPTIGIIIWMLIWQLDDLMILASFHSRCHMNERRASFWVFRESIWLNFCVLSCHSWSSSTACQCPVSAQIWAQSVSICQCSVSAQSILHHDGLWRYHDGIMTRSLVNLLFFKSKLTNCLDSYGRGIYRTSVGRPKIRSGIY